MVARLEPRAIFPKTVFLPQAFVAAALTTRPAATNEKTVAAHTVLQCHNAKTVGIHGTISLSFMQVHFGVKAGQFQCSV